MRVGILVSHPIQYYSSWFRELANRLDLHVFYAHRQSAAQQAQAGFGLAFDWDVDLLAGYDHFFLVNRAKKPNVSRFSGCDTPEIRDEIAKGKFDAFIVCGWYLKSYWQAVRACRNLHIPVLVRGDSQLATPRSLLKRSLKKLVYRNLFRSFDGFLAVGQRFSEYLRYYGVGKDRIFFVPHFVDNDWFAQRAAISTDERNIIRARWGASSSSFVVLFAGKLIPEKNPLEFVKGLVRSARDYSNIHGVIVGTGPLEEKMRRAASTINAPVHFAGFCNQSEMPSSYAAADTLALTSRSETWGLVVNEAFACGTPAVVSDVCGCVPDLIEEAITGFVYRSGESEELARKFIRMHDLRSVGHDFCAAVRKKVGGYDAGTAAVNTIEAIEQVHLLTRSSERRIDN